MSKNKVKKGDFAWCSSRVLRSYGGSKIHPVKIADMLGQYALVVQFTSSPKKLQVKPRCLNVSLDKDPSKKSYALPIPFAVNKSTLISSIPKYSLSDSKDIKLIEEIIKGKLPLK